MGHKMTKLQKEDLINGIALLMSNGITTRESILRYIAETLKKMKITKSPRSIEYYMTSARKLIQAENKVEISDHLSLALKQRNTMIEKLMKERKYKTALQTMDSRDRLLGLFIEKVEESGNISQTVFYVPDNNRLIKKENQKDGKNKVQEKIKNKKSKKDPE